MNNIPETGVPLIIPGEDVVALHSQLKEDCKNLPGSEVTASTSNLPQFPITGSISFDSKASLKEAEWTKTMRNFRENVKNWNNHFSFEGSAMLCVLLSLKEEAECSLDQLPVEDQDILKKLCPHEISAGIYGLLGDAEIKIRFDEKKDFVLTVMTQIGNVVTPHKIKIFNSVAHPRPGDLPKREDASIKVEDNGDKIQVGGKITLHKKTIDRVVGGHERPAMHIADEEAPKRQVGKNAYEIRADVLQMALDWSNRESVNIYSEDEVLKVAKKFYAFVENKR